MSLTPGFVQLRNTSASASASVDISRQFLIVKLVFDIVGVIPINIGDMYAKIFSQIFDSSIAENYEVRHVFEDLLKLADRTGVVDMTMEAIARRTNVPFEKVKAGIEELMKPDERSRSRENEGKRLVLVDNRRDWGWIIVNYAHYRALQDEETRREYFRNAKRKERANKPKRIKKAKGLPGEPLTGETQYIRALENEGQAAADALLDKEFAEQTPWEAMGGNREP